MSDMSMYSYATPLSYNNPAQQLSYIDPPSTDSGNKKQQMSPSAAVGTVGAVAGGIAGGVIGSKRNPYMKNGIPTDKFAKKAYDRYIKSAPEDIKNSYNQFNEVINKLDGIKTTDELKTLLNNNPLASNEISTALNKTTDEYLSSVTDTNLSANKTTIKTKLESANKTKFQDMKNKISEAWSADKNQFVKPDNMDENVFNSIKKTSRKVKSGFIAKWVVISAAAVGVVSAITHKIIKAKKQVSQV